MTKDEAVGRLLKIADAEVGYREKASNKDLDSKTANAGANNWTKYARDLDAISNYYNTRKNGYDWCDVFVDWCFVQTFGYPVGRLMLYQPERSLGAGTGYSAQYFKNVGAWASNPSVGDQIFFKTNAGAICHTGLVEIVGDSWIQTIEGNANNMVGRHVYNIRDRVIAGYGIPNWGLVSDSNPTPKPKDEVVIVETKELAKGATGQAVKSMQLLLIGNGFSCGDSGADGDFGNATKGAVMAFQKKKRLSQDGICGAKTWTKLING